MEKARKFFRRWARVIAGLILLACLALTVVYINAERMVEKNKGLNSMCNTVVPVKNGDVLKQTIWLNEKDNHYGSKLTLSPGTYSKVLTGGEVTISVINDENVVLCEKRIQATEIRDNTAIKIEWGGVNSDQNKLSKSGQYTICIQAEGLDETKDKLVFWCGSVEENEQENKDMSGAVKLTLNDTELNTQIYIQISYLQKDRGVLHACYYIVLALVVLSIYPMLPKAGEENEQNAQKEGQR